METVQVDKDTVKYVDTATRLRGLNSSPIIYKLDEFEEITSLLYASVSSSLKWNNNFCCSVAKSRLTLCDPMDYGCPGSSVLHCLPEFA